MAEVSVGDLRNSGGDIVARVTKGEAITITRSGEPVARLLALGPRPLSAEQLLERWRRLPPVDAVRLREDLDARRSGLSDILRRQERE